MLSKSLFEGNKMKGKLGQYPFTAENLVRVGLALCTYLKISKEIEKPLVVAKEANFITLAVLVGFMSGGGDAIIGAGEGHLELKSLSADEEELYIYGLEEHELKMVESILFSRYNMPRAKGEEVGSVWIQEKKP
jgi:hypothetical protein